MQSKKIFLTGATGFIGSHLVKALYTKGYVVTALVRSTSEEPAYLKGTPYKKVIGDLFNEELIDKEIAKCDAVIHAAACISFRGRERDVQELHRVNVTGTERIINATLQHKKRLVHISTASTIGIPTKTLQVMDETEPFVFDGATVYAQTKYLAEQRVLAGVKQGLDAVIVNPSSVFGYGDKKGAGPSLYPLLERYPIIVAPSGGAGIIAVGDVVTGIIAALKKGKAGERYILSSENMLYKEIFTISLRIIKEKNISLLTLPQVVGSLGSSIFRKLNLKSKILNPEVVTLLFNFRYLSNAKAKQMLDWTPGISIQQAIKESYQFYMQSKNSGRVKMVER